MRCEKKMFSHLGRIPDNKDFITRATVSLTAISGQNSYPHPLFFFSAAYFLSYLHMKFSFPKTIFSSEDSLKRYE